jgi:hypothetical protein
MRRATAALGLCVLAAGCGGAAGFHHPSAADLARLQRNSDEPVYYAGPSFAGLALSNAGTQGRGDEYVEYGTCSSGPSFLGDSSCAPPIEIEQLPFRPSAWRRAVGCHQLPNLRGVPTVRHDGLVLVTGRQIVKIYARSPAEDRRVASALRRVDGKPTAAALPPPSAATRSLVARVC